VPTDPLARLSGRPRDSLRDAYPDLRPLLRAVRRGDWSGVVGYFDGRPTGEDHSLAV